MSSPQELELYQKIEEGVKQAADASRRLAIIRGDVRWHKISELLMGVKSNVLKIYNSRRIVS